MNSLHRDIKEGEVVTLSAKFYKGDAESRKFKCESGFGMSTFTIGTAVFGVLVKDGKKCRVEGYEIEKEKKE